ncbi:MAG: hypothetical protein H7Y09_12150 [Chitinophagaceae bacterium]|nr:hypothetical protein [Anaerolineae bacterium]
MALFTIFVFGAVILGTGGMLSPAWPTIEPRIGLGAALSLAIIVGGAVFLTALVGWQTLLIDYLLFGLVIGIFLGGTLAVGQKRAEAKGETLADEDQGWPGPSDLMFLGVIAAVFTIAALLKLPQDSDNYLYAALAEQLDGEVEVISSYRLTLPDVYPPAFVILTAYLGKQLAQNVETVQMAAAAVFAFLNVWVIYDFGAELRDKRLGRVLALILGIGLFWVYLNGQYLTLLGLIFTQAFLIYTLRYSRFRYPADAVAAGLMLGAVVISDFGMIWVALLGYIGLIAVITFKEQRPSAKTGIVLAVGVPLIALVAISPWLLDALQVIGLSN